MTNTNQQGMTTITSFADVPACTSETDEAAFWATHELSDALSINPHASEDCARTLAGALTMPVGEQASRMQSMRTVVGHANAFRWAANVLTDAVAVHAARHGRSEFGRSAADTRAVASI